MDDVCGCCDANDPLNFSRHFRKGALTWRWVAVERRYWNIKTHTVQTLKHLTCGCVDSNDALQYVFELSAKRKTGQV